MIRGIGEKKKGTANQANLANDLEEDIQAMALTSYLFEIRRIRQIRGAFKILR